MKKLKGGLEGIIALVILVGIVIALIIAVILPMASSTKEGGDAAISRTSSFTAALKGE